MQGARLLRVAANGPNADRRLRKTRTLSVELASRKQKRDDTSERRKSVPSVGSTESPTIQRLNSTAPELGAVLAEAKSTPSQAEASGVFSVVCVCDALQMIILHSPTHQSH